MNNKYIAYPLRKNLTVVFKGLPVDLTKLEVRRLVAFLKALITDFGLNNDNK